MSFVPEIADPITVSEQRTYTQEGKNNFRLHNVVPEVASPILGTDGHNRTPGSMGDTEGLLIPEVVGALSDGAHRGGGRNGQDVYNGRIIPVAFKASHFTRDKDGAPSETYPPLSADADKGDQDPLVLTFAERTRAGGRNLEVSEDIAFAMTNAAAGGQTHSRRLLAHARVRRLTPLECERLQGFPDNFTRIMYRKKPAADGPRYRALGNSMAVPVMAWIGKRIDLVERMLIKLGRPNT